MIIHNKSCKLDFFVILVYNTRRNYLLAAKNFCHYSRYCFDSGLSSKARKLCVVICFHFIMEYAALLKTIFV